MKKILAILVLASAGAASAADYVSIDVEHVRGLQGQPNSTAQYIRAGKGFGDYQIGVQGRTAQTAKNARTNSSLEIYGSRNSVNIMGITPFIGAGHDNGPNGAGSYSYGLVGATYGLQVGPGTLLAGAKTRVGSTESSATTKQTLVYAAYRVPVAGQVSLNLTAARSSQTIKENSVGLGLTASF